MNRISNMKIKDLALINGWDTNENEVAHAHKCTYTHRQKYTNNFAFYLFAHSFIYLFLCITSRFNNKDQIIQMNRWWRAYVNERSQEINTNKRASERAKKWIWKGTHSKKVVDLHLSILVWFGLRAHNTVTVFYYCTAFSILDYFNQEFCLLYSNASLFGHFTCFFFIAIIIFFFNSLTFDFVWLKMIEERKTKVNKQAHKQMNEWTNELFWFII